MPQVHGPVRDAANTCAVLIELNGASDNPLVFGDGDDAEYAILSGGNFHGAPLSVAATSWRRPWPSWARSARGGRPAG